MRVALVDLAECSYTPDTPREQPLGGMQSAAAYLSEALARRGHGTWLLNRHRSEGTVRGVHSLPATLPACQSLVGIDAVLVIGGATPQAAAALRDAFGPATRLILWTGHGVEQPGMAHLADGNAQARWDGFAFVSDWQRNKFISELHIPFDKCGVMRNAIAPTFEGMWGDNPSINQEKTNGPILAYTSTPFRGLDVLLRAYPMVHRKFSKSTLAIYSSMKVYGQSENHDPYTDLYARAQGTAGARHVGGIGQRELARVLKGAAMLAYPNTFEETSCIAVMEAMAAGCLIVTVKRGALPETLAGFGHTVEPEEDPDRLAERFAAKVIDVLQLREENPESIDNNLRQQVSHVNTNGTWTVRAREWEAWLASAA